MDSEQLDFMKAYLKDSSRKDDSHSIGLKNVHQRIQLKFGQSYGLSISSEYGKGCEIKIKVPYITYNEVNSHENVIGG